MLAVRSSWNYLGRNRTSPKKGLYNHMKHVKKKKERKKKGMRETPGAVNSGQSATASADCWQGWKAI